MESKYSTGFCTTLKIVALFISVPPPEVLAYFRSCVSWKGNDSSETSSVSDSDLSFSDTANVVFPEMSHPQARKEETQEDAQVAANLSPAYVRIFFYLYGQ